MKYYLDFFQNEKAEAQGLYDWVWILTLTFTSSVALVNQSLRRALKSEGTEKRSAFQGCCPALKDTRKVPTFAPATVLVLRRLQWPLLSTGKGHVPGSRSLSSLQREVLTRIVQCLPESYLGDQKGHTSLTPPPVRFWLWCTARFGHLCHLRCGSWSIVYVTSLGCPLVGYRKDSVVGLLSSSCFYFTLTFE